MFPVRSLAASAIPVTARLGVAALSRIFQGYGDCTQIDWTFLKLSMPAWALVWLLILAGGLLFALRRRGVSRLEYDLE